ncbi:MAG: septal ring lytic transglycosylase RlpA family protein [Flavobacteriales bacterium]
MKWILSLIACLYVLIGQAQEKITTGTASYYANKFEGRKTSSGEIFRQDSLTAAHKKLPFGTYVRVTNLSNDSVVVVKINDRLPQKSKRSIDLTMAAAKQLNFVQKGLTKVQIEVLEVAKPLNRSPVDTFTFTKNDFLFYKDSIDQFLIQNHDSIGVLRTREALLAIDTTIVSQHLGTYYQMLAGTYLHSEWIHTDYNTRQTAIAYLYKAYFHDRKNRDILRPLMLALAENKRCGETRKIYGDYLAFTPRDKCEEGDAQFIGSRCSD